MSTKIFVIYLQICFFLPNYTTSNSLNVDLLLKIIDLTWAVNERSINWPNTSPFNYTKIVGKIINGTWYTAKEFCTSEHVGTHLDAPFHFNEYGWKVADIPVERLITNGALLDLTEKTYYKGENTTAEASDLSNWVALNGNFQPNTVLLIKFNWSKYWNSRDKYLGIIHETQSLQFPGLSIEAAEWIANNPNIVGVGIDVASVDLGKNKNFPAHIILSKRQKYILENVKLTEKLPVKGFKLLVLPMKLQEGSGAPVRILATQFQEKNSHS